MSERRTDHAPTALDLAAAAVRRVVADGLAPNGTASDSCGDFAEAVRLLYEAHADGGTAGARTVWTSQLAAAYPGLAAAVAGDGQGARERFTVIPFGEAYDERPPLTTRIEGLIFDGSVNVFFGDGGTKKTWLLLDAGIAVAMGKPFLGRETVQGGVLVVDEESGKRRLLDRLQALGHARGAPKDLPVYSFSLDGLDLFRDDADAEALRETIERLGVSLVIVDSLSMVASGAEENGTEDMAPVLRRLRQTAEATNAAFLIIHHANRTGTYRGSTAIKQSCDLMMKVESRDGSANIEFTTEKARDIEAIRMAAHIRFDNGADGRARAVFVSPADSVGTAPRLGAGEQYVLRFLAEHGASTVTAIKDRADTCSPVTARKAVYSLASLGLTVRVDSGAAGEEATYDLTDTARKRPAEPVPEADDDCF